MSAPSEWIVGIPYGVDCNPFSPNHSPWVVLPAPVWHHRHRFAEFQPPAPRSSRTANPGCILQLRAGVRLHDGREQVMHVVEVLDRAYRA